MFNDTTYNAVHHTKKNAAALQPFLHWYAVVITSDGTVHGKLTCFSFVLYSTFFLSASSQTLRQQWNPLIQNVTTQWR